MRKKRKTAPRLKRSWSLIELEISSSRGCRDRIDTLLVFEGPIVHPLPRSIIPFPWRRMRSAVFLVTTPIRELVSTPVEPRSRRCVPHATFIAPSILYARNNNLCIYYEGAGFPCKDRCKKKEMRSDHDKYACKLLCKSIDEWWRVVRKDGSVCAICPVIDQWEN